MVEPIETPSSQTELWDQFLHSSRPDVGFKQSSWWADFLTSRGWGHFGAVVKENGEIQGGAKVLIDTFAADRCFYYVPEGPVLPENQADAEQIFAALLAYIDEQRQAEAQVVSHLRLEPRWAERPSFVVGCQEASRALDPRNTLCIDLGLTEAAILEQMKPKGRYNIRVARRNGVTVVEDNSSRGVKDFLDIYKETFARHELHGHSTEYFDSLFPRLFAHDRGSIFFAEHGGQRLATTLVIYFGDRATYKYGGSRLANRQAMAPYLLHFEAILKAKALGHKWYDFYGIARQGNPEDPWANFSIFKRKFGGCEFNFVPALDYVYDAAAYQEYRHRK